jgi:4-hydroxybutyrate dehydrogenase / sulfolactaldehyde 3-reductase
MTEQGARAAHAAHTESSAGERVAFIGLGTMGMPMAKNVLQGGYALTAYDVRAEAVSVLVEAGARGAGSAREAAEGADVVITMLPDSPDVRVAVLGEGGVLDAMRSGAMLIEMSTIDPSVTREIAEAAAQKGVRMIDAPVGRNSVAAEAGKLLIMVGGEAAFLEECRPLLEQMGDTIHHCGPIGAGETVKIVNNLLSGSILLAAAEAVVLGVKAGISPDVLLNVLTGTAAGCWHLDNTFRNKVFNGDFAPGFKVRLAHKDLGLAQNLARENGVPLMVGSVGRELYAATMAQGLADQDWGAYTTVLERLVGTEARYEREEEAAGGN